MNTATDTCAASAAVALGNFRARSVGARWAPRSPAAGWGTAFLAHAVGSDRDSNTAAEGAFQHYSVVLEGMACPIPATLPHEGAAVLPLGASTAACGLFQADHLGQQLNLPPEYLLIHRVTAGTIGVLCHLEAEAPWRAELETLLPGFAPVRRRPRKAAKGPTP